jgi:hypothetical protein
MLGHPVTIAAREQRSPSAVAAFYATITAVATLGFAILLISANVAYALAR